MFITEVYCNEDLILEIDDNIPLDISFKYNIFSGKYKINFIMGIYDEGTIEYIMGIIKNKKRVELINKMLDLC